MSGRIFLVLIGVYVSVSFIHLLTALVTILGMIPLVKCERSVRGYLFVRNIESSDSVVFSLVTRDPFA